jgi:hypothetical protein
VRRLQSADHRISDRAAAAGSDFWRIPTERTVSREHLPEEGQVYWLVEDWHVQLRAEHPIVRGGHRDDGDVAIRRVFPQSREQTALRTSMTRRLAEQRRVL